MPTNNRSDRQLAEDLLTIIKRSQPQFSIVGNTLKSKINNEEVTIPIFNNSTVNEKLIGFR